MGGIRESRGDREKRKARVQAEVRLKRGTCNSMHPQPNRPGSGQSPARVSKQQTKQADQQPWLRVERSGGIARATLKAQESLEYREEAGHKMTGDNRRIATNQESEDTYVAAKASDLGLGVDSF